MEATEQSKPRGKAFTYRTHVTWSGGKTGMLGSHDKPTFRIASPPEFRGESGNWSPEELFVASVEGCHLMTFLAFAEREQLQLLSYESHANGVLEMVDGHFRFTRIVLFPTIVVAKSAREEEVYAMFTRAHQHCLVTNSISSIVEVNPTIILQ